MSGLGFPSKLKTLRRNTALPTIKATWEENNYNIISMKNDFKTIYGEGVEKVDFHF